MSSETEKHCCGSDCMGCEIYAKTKKRLAKAKKKPSKDEILWGR